MAAYSVEIKRAAARELERVEPRAQRLRIVSRIRALAAEPRPQGAQKLAGGESAYRLRQGDYRIVHEVFEKERRIVVFKIGHRRDVYR